MNKLLNNRIIAFVVYLILFLSILYLGNKQDSLLRFVLLSFYCVLVVNIQSKTRVVNNKISWIVSMFIFSPIAFPLFLLSDKKYFKKVLTLGIINILFWTILIYFSQQRLKLSESFSSWDKNNEEIQKIDEQILTVDFEDLSESSRDFLVDLTNDRIKKLDSISSSVNTIKENIFVKISTEQSDYYQIWNDNLKQQIVSWNMYLDIFKAMKEDQPVDSINKLISDWKIEDEKIANSEIKEPTTKKIIFYVFESINQLSVLFSAAVLLLLINIIAYIKLFGFKSWKIWIILGLNTIINVLMFDLKYWIG